MFVVSWQDGKASHRSNPMPEPDAERYAQELLDRQKASFAVVWRSDDEGS